MSLEPKLPQADDSLISRFRKWRRTTGRAAVVECVFCLVAIYQWLRDGLREWWTGNPRTVTRDP